MFSDHWGLAWAIFKCGYLQVELSERGEEAFPGEIEPGEEEQEHHHHRRGIGLIGVSSKSIARFL